jgi:hypothetical protein
MDCNSFTGSSPRSRDQDVPEDHGDINNFDDLWHRSDLFGTGAQHNRENCSDNVPGSPSGYVNDLYGSEWAGSYSPGPPAPLISSVSSVGGAGPLDSFRHVGDGNFNVFKNIIFKETPLYTNSTNFHPRQQQPSLALNTVPYGSLSLEAPHPEFDPPQGSTVSPQDLDVNSPSTTSLTWQSWSPSPQATAASPTFSCSFSPALPFSTLVVDYEAFSSDFLTDSTMDIKYLLASSPLPILSTTPPAYPTSPGGVFDMPNAPSHDDTADHDNNNNDDNDDDDDDDNNDAEAQMMSMRDIPVPELEEHPTSPAPHSSPKKKRCTICNKLVGSKERDYRRHEETHNPQRFPCEMCDKVCTRLDNLKRHMRKFHEVDLPALPKGPPKGRKRQKKGQSGNEGG